MWEWIKKLFGLGEKKTPAPRPAPPMEPYITTRPAGPSIPQPGSTPTTTGTGSVTPITPAPTPGGGFIPLGSAEDEVGNPALARTVDITASRFLILGAAKLYAPGDTAKFFVQAISKPTSDGALSDRAPVAGLPVVVRNKAQKRKLAGPVTTDTQGIAILSYVVTEQDQIGDPATPEPDSGSYLCNAYVGGRLLNTVVVLWDTA